MKTIQGLILQIFCATFEHELLPNTPVMGKASYTSGHEMYVLQYLGLGKWRTLETLENTTENRALYPPFREYKTAKIHLA